MTKSDKPVLAKIAIASGKGGTGKTTVATNLACVAVRNGREVAYLDCDVEEPNGHIFLKPQISKSAPVGNLVPQVDEARCVHCGKCGEICQYSAIVCVGEKVLVYPELCHACGGCMLVCPADAISEVTRETGKLETGQAGSIRFVHGLLNVGEAMSPPLIKAVKAAAPEAGLVIIDAPPGTSCPVIESVRGSDFVILVTEPTPFGLNDLKLAVEMIRALKLPFGVVINRADIGDSETRSYCDANRIEILAEIPDDRRIAEAYSRGQMACDVLPDYSQLFAELAEKAELRLSEAQVAKGGGGNMKELVVISGKGGTGKTSIVASFAALAEKVVLADCDVDAADLHLVLDPTTIKSEKFSGGSRARIMSGHCTACGKCEEVCRFDAVYFDGPGNGKVAKTYRIDPIACEGCGVCAWFCNDKAIEFSPAVNGEWFVSDTRCGPMVHAKLGVAEENSGKLVSLVRTQAKQIAEDQKLDMVLIDGSPGIGCPVIASITGADIVLIVTEPTLSGLHDMKRVADLTRHFGIESMVCINKWDINPELTAEIERQAGEHGLMLAGKVRYDRAVTEAQIKKLSVVEYTSDGIADDIRGLWSNVETSLKTKPRR